MNILLIGGSCNLMNRLIIKLKKEGHRVHLLTGQQFSVSVSEYEKVFERYEFSYDNANLNEIFESVAPDVTLFLGAYDTNFSWQNGERESVRFISSLMNLLVAYSVVNKGKFIFLSSEEVYQGRYQKMIREEQPACPKGLRGVVQAQAEDICASFRESWKRDVLVLRLDHLYSVPQTVEEMDGVCANMCRKAMETGVIRAAPDVACSLLYEPDAVEFIYLIVSARKTNYSLYHLSAAEPLTEVGLAKIVVRNMNEPVNVVPVNKPYKSSRVLSNERFLKEFGGSVCHPAADGVKKVVSHMQKNRDVFLNGGQAKLPLWKRMWQRFGWFLKVSVPFIENMICFIPAFMLNNRTAGSTYFSRLDFYLFYVLLFAIVYGQHQAIFSAVLAVSGYLFRQMYTRSGFEVMLDYTTYVWMAQLFIVGLVVGYMKDRTRSVRAESEEIQQNLNRQLRDIKDINSSNVRVKDVLERQVIDQKDSIGKLYNITSTLDQYMPEEVLFYAVDILSQIMRSPDVAVYVVYNSDYARMFSASSKEARKLGNSIRYPDMGVLYEDLVARKVFINRKLDDRYPLMANAIYENDEMKMIVMVWGIPWERMTLGQANLLVVISYLIQNAVLRAGRYMAALEQQRYMVDTHILEPEAFTSLVKAYQKAKKRNLTECTLLQIKALPEEYEAAGEVLMKNLRQSDYLGAMTDGRLYVLLANTVRNEAEIVVNRFKAAGYESRIVEKLGV